MKYNNFLASIEKLSPAKKIALVEYFGSAKAVFEAGINEYQMLSKLNAKDIEMLEHHKKSYDLDFEYERCLKENVRIIPFDSPFYPEGLNDISNKPYAIYVKGNLPGNQMKVSIVGARKCTEYGRSASYKLGKVLGVNGVEVISGMAAGIDSAAHNGSLSANARTFAVLGCGVDICYPAISKNVYYDILDKGGGLISEYPLGSDPLSWHFPSRNRIISALCNILVIIEAREKSGSLITTDFALEQGREIYAVPGRLDDVLSGGCNRLISQGCGIIYNIDEFVENICNTQTIHSNLLKSVEIVLEKEELIVYSCVDLHPKFVNQIIEETHMNFLMVFAALDRLMSLKLVKEIYPNYYCRII